MTRGRSPAPSSACSKKCGTAERARGSSRRSPTTRCTGRATSVRPRRRTTRSTALSGTSTRCAKARGREKFTAAKGSRFQVFPGGWTFWGATGKTRSTKSRSTKTILQGNSISRRSSRRKRPHRSSTRWAKLANTATREMNIKTVVLPSTGLTSTIEAPAHQHPRLRPGSRAWSVPAVFGQQQFPVSSSTSSRPAKLFRRKTSRAAGFCGACRCSWPACPRTPSTTTHTGTWRTGARCCAWCFRYRRRRRGRAFRDLTTFGKTTTGTQWRTSKRATTPTKQASSTSVSAARGREGVRVLLARRGA
mmetsp:Transcript_4325/g.10557  ORF Transcript_4325/g.10557 Transcript_4325/m.10557 type:complete len:305 (+) Transcript_4325:1337-2251(+)